MASRKGVKKDFKEIKVPWEYRIHIFIPLLTCLPYTSASAFSCSFAVRISPKCGKAAGSRMKTSQGQHMELLWVPLVEMEGVAKETGA